MNFLGFNFNEYSVEEAIFLINKNIDNNVKTTVFTPNAELIVRAHEDDFLKEVYSNAGILTIDSWVVFYFARIMGHKIKEPASAANIMFRMLPILKEKKYRVYLLGASNEVVKIVNDKLFEMGINVVGYNDGYFDKENPGGIIEKINKLNPDILFVAMSTPFKEKFIYKNLGLMNIKIAIGVGGSFDILAGKCKHAPVWISKIGLEWFYRFVQEPRRLWKRYLVTNTKFIVLFFRYLLICKEKK